MNNIQIFSSPEFGKIRTVMIEGEPWFVAKDISEKLGYSKPANMVKLVYDDDKRNMRSSDLEPGSKGAVYQISMINESGLYAAIFASKLENAKKFKKWVTSEVLPSIRQTGTYVQPQLPQTPMEVLELHYKVIKEVDGKVADTNRRIDELDGKLDGALLDLPIFGVEENKISIAVKAKGVQVMGGKKSNAYKDRRIVNVVYRDIYGQIYRNFGINTYKALKRSQCEKALEVINKYEPPVILADRIKNTNAQQILEV